MSRRDVVVSLKDGGHVAYDEYGDPEGTPVLFCHGWPSSRTMGELADAAGRELRIRIISPDRPGISRSAFQSGRKLLDWPPVIEQLANSLGLDEFRVLGISGGAPYAYVTAWAMPERVRAVAAVSGAPPIAELLDRTGLWKIYRWMLSIYEIRPQLLRSAFFLARPFAMLRIPLRLRPLVLRFLQQHDAAALREQAMFNIFFESQRHAWRGSREGVIADAQIYAEPWGFALEDVNAPVRIWHGKQDRSFSYELAQQVAARFPHCELKIIDGAGHYSLPVRYMREILADLKSA